MLPRRLSPALSAPGERRPSSRAARATGRPTPSNSRSWPGSRSSSDLGSSPRSSSSARLVGYRRRVERAREAELARLAQAALTDSLTGLGNHRAFHEDLRARARAPRALRLALQRRHARSRRPEADQRHARPPGRRRRGSGPSPTACARRCASTDTAYRIGGDELMVLLPDQRGVGRASRSRSAFSARRRSHRTGVSVHLRDRRGDGVRGRRDARFATPTSRSTRRSGRAGGSSSTRTGSRRSRPRRPRSARRATTSGSSRPRSRGRSTPRTPERATTARPSPSSAC